ncbi:hypothetical protein ASG41_16205 [Modestobacter sp. Leaf380]|nr:hypothetical protein ASG41_16205 [Modestobacter sp. Leaf380]
MDRRGWRTLRADPAGLVVGTVFALLAMTPSLLPRTWFFQAVVSGISAAIGYGVAVGLVWLLRRWSRWQQVEAWARARLPGWVRTTAWLVLLVAVPVSLLVVLTIASDWQREVRALIGLPGETAAGWLRAAPAIVVVAVLLVALARGVRWIGRLVTRVLRRVRLPQRPAQVIGGLVALAVVVGLVEGVVLRWALSAADTSFSVTNDETKDGVEQPTLAERSGSPGSLAAWDTLGSEGQAFVAGGPSRARIAGAAGVDEDAVTVPIRAYVGLESADAPEDRAALAVAELERTGAFDREVLAVVTTTGTGWVNSAAPQALELVYGGDTATVATQYSYLPSWLSFIVDRSRAAAAGRTLFDAVYERVQQLPEAGRPRLLVYGESLGSAGSEAAFSGLADIRERADGVLWVGPPNSNELWSAFVERRDPGEPEVEPVYAGGIAVRFGSGIEDLEEPATEWLDPRVVYLQHPTDPIVWWSPDLLLTRPDWLVEPRGEGVSPAMSWYPVVTFWQVTVDMTNAQSPPDGYGHNYGDLLLDAWLLIAPPDGWTAADTDRARAVVG